MSTRVAFLTAGVRVDLIGADEHVVDLVRRVAAPSIVDAPIERPVVTVAASDIAGPADADPGQAAARLLHAVHCAALDATPTLPIHAAALAAHGGCVMLPAASGAGKSTLAAAAMQRGLTLVSDEAACLTSPARLIVPHTRPIKLSRTSRRLLGVSDESDAEAEIGLAPDIFGLAAAPTSTHRCVGVLLPRREPGQTAALEPVSKSVALAAVLEHRLHYGQRAWSNERAWDFLTEFVGGVRAAVLRFDDPFQAADRLIEVLTPSR